MPRRETLGWYRRLLQLRHRWPDPRADGPADSTAGVDRASGAFIVSRGERALLVVNPTTAAIDSALDRGPVRELLLANDPAAELDERLRLGAGCTALCRV